ncbi:MAG TPA: heavy metal sensor histidine kinase [Novimethylophilus sp.]|jgi:two-component system heavy metal sensor histidine kinase CusS|uniref:heavy metal sensor histidine kinase n=1 Tax=Novimethylophilus sp. TaxID=2137426 RepID=UPI002F420902
MNPESITSRLTLFFSTVSTLVLLVVGTLIGTLVESHFEEQDLMELNGKLELVRHALAKVHTPSDLATAPQSLSDALIGHPDLSVAIRGHDRRVLFTSSSAIFATHLLEQPSHGDSSGKSRLVMWEQGGEAYRGISAVAATGIAGQPPATVALAINIERHRAFMKAFRNNLWLAIAAGIALTVVLGWVAARRGLAPVREMADVAKGISVSHLGDRLSPETVPTELVDLAIAFNEMLARLEDSFRRLSDFSSDLAHELRTPISNLMTQTQVAVSKERPADEYREVLYSNLEEYERLARMIADMLFLAKADNGLIIPSSETVDLPTEVRELFGFYEAFAEEQDVSLVLVGEGSVRGDRLMLRRALSNLLSNAIRHTPRHGAVKVIIRQEAESGKIRLTFENPGESIQPEHLPRLFDRFFRVDSSRRKASDGAGLGLAITKSVVEAHQGKIQAFSADGVTRFEIIFPITDR